MLHVITTFNKDSVTSEFMYLGDTTLVENNPIEEEAEEEEQEEVKGEVTKEADDDDGDEEVFSLRNDPRSQDEREAKYLEQARRSLKTGLSILGEEIDAKEKEEEIRMKSPSIQEKRDIFRKSLEDALKKRNKAGIAIPMGPRPTTHDTKDDEVMPRESAAMLGAVNKNRASLGDRRRRPPSKRRSPPQDQSND